MVSYTQASLLPWKIAAITLWIGGCLGPLVGLDAMEKRKYLPLQGAKPLPSNSSLYRLSYPESLEFMQLLL
jgi:hypothetical protein